MSNPKRAKCPTCGKFLNNDVAALRESLEKVKNQLNETIAALDKAKADSLKWEKAYNDKNATCEELMSYDHWLANRKLWQRIVNVLERPEP